MCALRSVYFVRQERKSVIVSESKKNRIEQDLPADSGQKKKVREENKKARKLKKVRINKVLRPVSVFLLILFLQLVLNFDSTCYLFNHSSYQEVTARISEKKTDPYLMLIPMVSLTYDYNGQSYTTDKFFVLQPSFGISTQKDDAVTVYVNTKAPGYAIFKTNFFRNPWNWVLMVISVCCLWRIVQLIRLMIRRRKKIRAEKVRRKKEENDEGILS